MGRLKMITGIQKHSEILYAFPSKSAQRTSTPLSFGDSQSSEVFWPITQHSVIAMMQTLLSSPNTTLEITTQM